MNHLGRRWRPIRRKEIYRFRTSRTRRRHARRGAARAADRAGQLLRGAGREDTPYRALRIRRRASAHPRVSTPRADGHLGSFSKIWRLGCGLAGLCERGDLPRLGLLKLARKPRAHLNMAATSAYLARYDLAAHIAKALPVYGISET